MGLADKGSLQRESKTCTVCGRTIEWRKKWERDWDHVRYCSDACRKRKIDAADAALEEAVLTLLARRGAGKTICPSEVARALHPEDWEQWMARTRAAGRRLVAQGKIVITQRGQVADPSRARGAIRFRKA
ncbi:MAG: DUF3253 domain-containing protein [Acidobacteriaceae bacterium]